MSELATINEEQWEEMLDLLEEDFVELVEQYLVDSRARVETIEQAHKAANNELGLEEAHTLKGASANLGMDALAKYCFDMQNICHANMIGDAYNVVADIQEEFAKVSA
ncbi:MAG: hypothetical protein CR966_01390, partial [Pseudomonadales bacterium]